MNALKDRVEACLEVWSHILKRQVKNRRAVVELLRKVYERRKVEPIRGKTKIKIYDKEMITLYLIGKYGLGVFNENDHSRIFSKEMMIERSFEEIAEGGNPREVLSKYFAKIDENLVFRVLRLGLTKVLFNWEDENRFIRVLREFEKNWPELDYKFRSFKKFYIALMIAKSIVEGKIRNRLEKEALKHSLCIRLGAEKSAPPDSFIRDIAINVFKGEEYEVNKALSTKESIELDLKA